MLRLAKRQQNAYCAPCFTKILIWLSLICIPYVWYSGTAAAAKPSILLPTAAEWQAALDQARANSSIPAAVAGIAVCDQSPLIAASGLANLADNTPVLPDDCFAVGSITKTFVAVAALQLAEENRLALDDPLAKYMPAFPNAEAITLRHLMQHTSGLADYVRHCEGMPRLVQALVLLDKPTQEEVVGLISALPIHFAPGTGCAYSSSNYYLLGIVIERVTGQALGQVLHERIIDPLALTSTYFPSYDQLPSSAMRGYLRNKAVYYDLTSWESAPLAWAAGALVSNATDLIRFSEVLFGGGLLSPDSLAEMTTHRVACGNLEYGLGLYTYDLAIGNGLGHNGQTLGFSTQFCYLVESDVTLVVLTNLTYDDSTSLFPATSILEKLVAVLTETM